MSCCPTLVLPCLCARRPDWDKCADYISGGILRWKEHEGKSSDELVDVLLAEIAGSPGAEVAGAQFFDGLVSRRNFWFIPPYGVWFSDSAYLFVGSAILE